MWSAKSSKRFWLEEARFENWQAAAIDYIRERKIQKPANAGIWEPSKVWQRPKSTSARSSFSSATNLKSGPSLEIAGANGESNCPIAMKVSIVVPAYNEEKMLPRSLNAIRQATRAFTEIGWESKIVVCDNNSTDRTAQIAAENGAEVVFEPINQIARARNRGAAGACGEWLIFVDADSFPT